MKQEQLKVNKITFEDRKLIEQYLKEGKKPYLIERILKKSVALEISRYGKREVYNAVSAQERQDIIEKERIRKLHDKKPKNRYTPRRVCINNSFIKKFCQNLEQIRTEKKLSKTEVSKLCYMNNNTYGSIEKGYINISLLTLEKIFKGLNIEVMELFKD